MCKMLYIGSSGALTLIPHDSSAPAFYVRAVESPSPELKIHFSLPNIYFVGSWEGCGCAFEAMNYDDLSPEDKETVRDEENQDLVDESVRCLRDYLRAALSVHEKLELYYCWDGDEVIPTEKCVCVRTTPGEDIKFTLIEKGLVVLERARANA